MRAAMMVLLLSTFWATATVPAEPPAPPDVAMLVSGVIHDALGLPLADVEISCWWLEESMLTGATFTPLDGVVHTDKDGRFLWMGTYPDGTPTPENPMAPHNRRRGFLVTRHPGHGITMTPWHRFDSGVYRGAREVKDIPAELLPPPTAEPLKLPQRAAASGVVRDGQGGPVAGATVTASIALPHRVRKPVPPPGFYDPNPPHLPFMRDLSTLDDSNH